MDHFARKDQESQTALTTMTSLTPDHHRQGNRNEIAVAEQRYNVLTTELPETSLCVRDNDMSLVSLLHHGQKTFFCSKLVSSSSSWLPYSDNSTIPSDDFMGLGYQEINSYNHGFTEEVTSEVDAATDRRNRLLQVIDEALTMSLEDDDAFRLMTQQHDRYHHITTDHVPTFWSTTQPRQ